MILRKSEQVFFLASICINFKQYIIAYINTKFFSGKKS
jgi:hypothetical protein